MNNPSLEYMLDTNVFSKIVSEKILVSDLPQGTFWATTVQLEELKDTQGDQKKQQLLSLFKELIPSMIPPGLTWGVKGAGWGEGEWRTDGSLWDLLKKELDEAWARKPSRKRKSSNKENNPKDATIAEAAKFNDFTLLTFDKDVAEVCEKVGIKVQLLTHLRP
jgi:predicted nucleic acid-binding protein